MNDNKIHLATATKSTRSANTHTRATDDNNKERTNKRFRKFYVYFLLGDGGAHLKINKIFITAITQIAAANE